MATSFSRGPAWSNQRGFFVSRDVLCILDAGGCALAVSPSARPLGWPAPVQGLGKGRYAPKSNGYPFKHTAFRAPLAYLHAGRAYFIAITIEGSNIVSARIGKREKPGWKAGFLIAKSIFRSLTQYFETTGTGA
jgi:hypothetical protein